MNGNAAKMGGGPWLGAKDYTPEITKRKIHWKVLLKVH